jgi:hypothetical protein
LKPSILFLQRYDVLYNFWIADLWTSIPDALMRKRPHERVNSIAWNLWHLSRVEDAGLNRFVSDRPQVLEDGWLEKMEIPWRHHGGGMSMPEVDELSLRINLPALHGYSDAVQARTREIVRSLAAQDLDAVMQADRLRMILVDEGLAHSDPESLLQNYLGWSKGKCLSNFGLTHPYQHIGEIGVIASLLGVVFD